MDYVSVTEAGAALAEDSYFQFLPNELVCTIFSYFPIIQVYPVLSQVCSTFRRRLLQGCMWKTIEGFPSTGVSSNLSVDTIFDMVNFLNTNALSGQVKMLDIPRCKCALPCPTTEFFAPLFSNLRSLSIRNSTMGGVSSWLTEVAIPIDQSITWPSMKFLNLCNTNLQSSQFFKCVTVPNLESLILSGVAVSNSDDMLNFILRSSKYLKNLDISRTKLDETALGFIVRGSPKLENLVATELKWRPLEETLQAMYGHLKIRTQLLPHRKDNLARRIPDVACLYDVDGNGCSLVADAIYVGIKCDVINYLIQSLDIDVNRCDCLPSPWCVPYPTKYIESFELLRAPLPFHQSILLNKFDISNMLLTFGADLYGKTPSGLTPLMNILSSSIIDAQSRDHAITYLLEKKVAVDFGSMLNAIEKTVAEVVVLNMLGQIEGHPSTLKLNRLLHEATIRGRTQVAVRLIQLGADVSSLIDDRENCLVAAIKRRNYSMVDAILDTETKVLPTALTTKDFCGWTALTFAVAIIPTNELEKIVTKMVNAGARVEDLIKSTPELPALTIAVDSIRKSTILNKMMEAEMDTSNIGGEVTSINTNVFELDGPMYSEYDRLPDDIARGDIIRRLILNSSIDVNSIDMDASKPRYTSDSMSEMA